MAKAPLPVRGKLRVHLENSRKKPGEKEYTLARFVAAAAKHRALARRLDVSVGYDGDISDAALREVDVMLGVPPARHRLQTGAPKLRWLHTPMAGIDTLLPLDWLPAGAIFTNNVGVHGAKAREYVRMAISMLHTRLPQMLANQRQHRWQQIFTPTLQDKTALVIGLGDVGGGAARAAGDLGLKVIAVTRSGKASPLATRVVRPTQLDRVLPLADFVILAAPNTADTRGLLDARRIDLLKPHCGIVNISRAALLDHDALCARLREGSLAGAVLDVMYKEPLPADSPYWDVPNLVITPHISCDDSDYAALTLERWFDNLARLVAGRPLSNRIDPKRGY
jgi:phosphoglycerate dehydrogenase-like enzyme